MADDDSGDRDASGGDDAQWDGSSAWDDSDAWGANGDRGFESDTDTDSDTSVNADANLEDEAKDDPAADPDDRIPIDLSRDRGDATADADGAATDEADDVYEREPNSTPIEPGDPDLENVVFVVIGAIVMLLVLVRLASLPL